MGVVFTGYAILINAAALAAMANDKSRARRGVWRISERTLFVLALLGGSIGAWLGMYCFHHKTKHLKFVIGIPLIAFVQLAAVVFVIFKYFI